MGSRHGLGGVPLRSDHGVLSHVRGGQQDLSRATGTMCHAVSRFGSNFSMLNGGGGGWWWWRGRCGVVWVCVWEVRVRMWVVVGLLGHMGTSWVGGEALDSVGLGEGSQAGTVGS